MTTGAVQHGQWFEMMKAMLIQRLALMGVGSGNWFWVDSNNGTDQVRSGEEPAYPVASWDYGYSLGSANNDDVVVLMPGHEETIAAAGDVVLDLAGMTTIGLGWGASTMPKITYSGVGGADLDVSAAGNTVTGLHFFNSENGCTAPIDVNSSSFRLINCILECDGVNDALDYIMLDGNADYFELINCINRGTDTAGSDSLVSCSAAVDHIRIVGLESHGNFAQANIDLGPAACTDLLIKDCYLENANAAADRCILGNAAQTGWIGRNFCMIPDDTETTAIETPGAASLFQNFFTNQPGEAGILAGVPSA